MRLCFTLRHARGDPNDFGRLVPVRLSKMIRYVITHPEADPKTKSTVDALLAKLLPTVKRRDSILA